MSIQWGKRWDPSYIYSADYECPECKWTPNFLKHENLAMYTIGIDSEAPPQQTRKYGCCSNY